MDHLDVVAFAGEHFTKQEVLDSFKHLKTRASETLRVYYAGHGGYFPAEGQACSSTTTWWRGSAGSASWSLNWTGCTEEGIERLRKALPETTLDVCK